MRAASGVLCAVLGLTLSGCGFAQGFSQGVSEGLNSTPAATAQAAAPSADSTAFVQRARQIAPDIYGSDSHLLSEAKSTCLDITQGKPPKTVATNAAARFSSGSYTVTGSQAAKLVQAAKDTVCHA